MFSRFAEEFSHFRPPRLNIDHVAHIQNLSHSKPYNFASLIFRTNYFNSPASTELTERAHQFQTQSSINFSLTEEKSSRPWKCGRVSDSSFCNCNLSPVQKMSMTLMEIWSFRNKFCWLRCIFAGIKTVWSYEIKIWRIVSISDSRRNRFSFLKFSYYNPKDGLKKPPRIWIWKKAVVLSHFENLIEYYVKFHFKFPSRTYKENSESVISISSLTIISKINWE